MSEEEAFHFMSPSPTNHAQDGQESPGSLEESNTDWLDEPLFSPQAEDSSPMQRKGIWFEWRSPMLEPVVPRSTIERDCSSKLTSHWDSVISRFKYVIVVLTLCVLWPFGAISFRRFSQATDSTFHPISNSLSAKAQKAFAESYKNDWSDPMHPSMLVVLESSDKNQSLINKASPAYAVARNFSSGLASTLETTCWDGLVCPLNETWTRVSSYYSIQDLKLSWLANSLVTPDGQTSMIQVQYLLPTNETNPRARIRELQDKIQEYGSNHSTEEFKVSYTGLKFFQSDLMESTQSDLKHMDAIVLPLSLLLLGMVLPRARTGIVWIIPLITIVSTICAWSIVMRFVATKTQITQFTPSVMMSLTLGMGVDYTLFLLSRYLERNRSNKIQNMIENGGHVILTSGITLMCTFLGLCFLPLQMLKSVGIGASVAIGCALFVNLTVVPALLHTRLGDWIIQEPERQEMPQQDPESSLETPLLDSTPGPESSQPYVEPEESVTSIWHRLALQLLHPKRAALILFGIVVLLLPVAWHAGEVKSSISFDLLLPSASPSLRTFHSLGHKLGWGRLSPYRILFDGRSAKLELTSSKGFDLIHLVIKEMMAIDAAGEEESAVTKDAANDFDQNLHHYELENHRITPQDSYGENVIVFKNTSTTNSTARRTQYSGVAVLRNDPVPHSLFAAAKACGRIKPYCPVASLHLIDYIDHDLTAQHGYVTYVSATLGVNPFSDEGVAWLVSARETLARLEDGGVLGGVEVYIEGGAAIAYDAVQAVYAAFPTVITRTMVVVFLLMAFFFRSFVTPLRSIVSIGLTLSFVFGLGVLVYQLGILNWTGIQSWSTLEPSEICWLTPIMAFSIIVGLALDYDVFLISRILEYRLKGFDHESSIVAGVKATGSIITAAGVIMAVAFGGLMLSSSPALYQWSFFLTTAVLLDTFVIRTLIVPITLGYTGKCSWWPRKLPEERITLIEGPNEESVNHDALNSDEQLDNSEVSPLMTADSIETPTVPDGAVP